jgi:hypothetical protein
MLPAWVQLAVARQALDGAEPPLPLHRRKGHAGQDSTIFNMHSARAAFTAIAAFLRARQIQLPA